MSNIYQYLEVLEAGPVSKARLLNHRPFHADELARLADEWNAVADRPDCQTLVMDCSNVTVLSSEMLSKLVLLQRRLKEKKANLILSGLRAEVREVLSWTRLDRFFEIQEDAEAETAAVGENRG